MMPPVGAGNKSKYILRQFPIIRFYGALALSLAYFLVQIVVANAAHSLILQIDSYHMVYNILSLITCITTAKVSKGNTLKNTFGWRRIDVCGAVASLIFLAALGFSVVVESIQAMLHASHHEKMRFAVLVGAVGVLGLIVNFVIYLLIGGYTLHQSGFLCPTKDNREDESIISATMRRGPYDHVMRERQGVYETFRDVFGCVLVVICAILVYLYDDSADYVDPTFTVVTVAVLAVTSYKYGKEAGHILLLTIPDHINVTALQENLKRSFPEVSDIHEFHVWQLTPGRIIATVHVVLQKPQGYLSIQNSIIHFLHSQGISHVTMQPEFVQMNDGEVDSPQTTRRKKCFLPCRCEDDDCHGRRCCNDEEDEHDHDHDLDDEVVHFHHHTHRHRRDYSQTSTTTTSPSNVQSPCSTSLQSGGQAGRASKSDSLNNHLDLSQEGGDSIQNPGGSTTFAASSTHDESDESSDEEQVQAELRPMI